MSLTLHFPLTLKSMAMKATWCRVPGCKMTGDHCLALKLNLENSELEFVGGRSGYGHGELTCHTPKLMEQVVHWGHALNVCLQDSTRVAFPWANIANVASRCKSYWNISQTHGQIHEDDLKRLIYVAPESLRLVRTIGLTIELGGESARNHPIAASGATR